MSAQVLPLVSYFDDAGQLRSTGDLKGAPTILVPIYTRCHGSCPVMAQSLKKAIITSDEPSGNYHVVLFSFDPRDGKADLKSFREHEHLPFQWTLARASASDTEKVMNAIDFHYTYADGEFLHPNRVTILDSRLRVAKSLSGDSYSASQISHALAVARGNTDFRDWAEPLGFGIALLVLVFSTGFLLHQISSIRQRSE